METCLPYECGIYPEIESHRSGWLLIFMNISLPKKAGFWYSTILLYSFYHLTILLTTSVIVLTLLFLRFGLNFGLSFYNKRSIQLENHLYSR